MKIVLMEIIYHYVQLLILITVNIHNANNFRFFSSFHIFRASGKLKCAMEGPSSEILIKSFNEMLFKLVLSLDLILFWVENPLLHVALLSQSHNIGHDIFILGSKVKAHITEGRSLI